MRYLLAVRAMIAVMTVAVILACTPRQEPLNIAVTPYLGFQPLFLAPAELRCEHCPESSHYIGGKAFAVNLVPSMHVVSRLFYAGEIDASMMSLEEALELNAFTQGGVCVAKVLGPAIGTRAIVMRAGDSAQPRKLGYEQSPFNGYLLAEAMQALHWQSGHTEFHFISLKQQPQALLDREVDAVLAVEPYLSELQAQGAVVVFDDKTLQADAYDVFVVSVAAFQQHQHLVEWLAGEYWASGVDALTQNRSDVARAVETNTGITALNFQQAVRNVPYLSEPKHVEAVFELDALLEQARQRTSQPLSAPALQACAVAAGY